MSNGVLFALAVVSFGLSASIFVVAVRVHRYYRNRVVLDPETVELAGRWSAAVDSGQSTLEGLDGTRITTLRASVDITARVWRVSRLQLRRQERRQARRGRHAAEESR